jgi:AAA+ ATPase superfamily predicted ATPase
LAKAVSRIVIRLEADPAGKKSSAPRRRPVTLYYVTITLFDVTQNPFVYGEVVPAAAFADRVVELDRLVRDLAAAQKVFLISPRRYGKSSLIRLALAAMARRGMLTVDVTVSSFSSYVAFLEGYARALAAAETRAERARTWLRDAISSTLVEIGPDLRAASLPPAGGRPPGPTVSFPNARTDRDVSRLAEEVFALPARLADTRRRPVVVALDEFQAIAGFNGGSVEHALRAAVQRQRDVGYVFAGSEPSLMERMLAARRPFYKAGPVMRLDKIPADEFATFVDRRFLRSGMKPEPGLGAAIVELAGNLPYDVQRLAHETWDEVRGRNRRRATLDDLHQTLRRMLAEQQTMFEATWQRLTLPQRAVLRAVVLEHGTELLSADVRTRHRLGGPSTVQTALAALVRDDVVTREPDGYAVVDSLLREWVARQTF